MTSILRAVSRQFRTFFFWINSDVPFRVWLFLILYLFIVHVRFAALGFVTIFYMGILLYNRFVQSILAQQTVAI